MYNLYPVKKKVDDTSHMMMNPCVDVVEASGRSKAVVVVDELSSSAAVQWNDDLLTEILLRLSVKPLLRFKRVNKRWLKLISDPYLCFRRHTLRRGVSGIFLRNQTSGEFEFVSLSLNDRSSASPFKSPDPDPDPDPDPKGIQILQSCNGLLLCTTPYPSEYFIYNPTTKHLKVLPDVSSLLGLGLNLAFDPSRSPNYTVVCVSRISDPPPDRLGFCEIMVYSSESETSRKWTRGGSCDSFYAPHDMDFQHGVYWNGALHWICSETRMSLCFDLSQECLKSNNYMPPLPHDLFHFVAAAACGGLHLVEDRIAEATHLRVFRLERDYSRWVPTYIVDHTKIFQAACPGYYYYYKPLSLFQFQDDSEEDPFLLLQISGICCRKVIALRLKDSRSYKVRDASSGVWNEWNDVYDYIESLAGV